MAENPPSNPHTSYPHVPQIPKVGGKGKKLPSAFPTHGGLRELGGKCCELIPEIYLPRSPQDVTERLDRLIDEIREKYHRFAIENATGCGDVLVVAHGHILRAFAMRWARKTLQDGPTFLLEAGGVGTLR